MDRSDIIKLVKTTYTNDKINQRIPTESARIVFCSVRSITQSEWYEAGKNGLKPTYCFEVFGPDYEGEKIVEYNGTRYGIYRTYRNKNERLELYAEEKGGLGLGNKD